MRRQPGEMLLLEMEESTTRDLSFHRTLVGLTDTVTLKNHLRAPVCFPGRFLTLCYTNHCLLSTFSFDCNKLPQSETHIHSILTCFHQLSEITLRSSETCQKTHLLELHMATDVRVKWRGRLFSSSKSLSILQWFWIPTMKLYTTER